MPPCQGRAQIHISTFRLRYANVRRAQIRRGRSANITIAEGILNGMEFPDLKFKIITINLPDGPLKFKMTDI